MKNIALLTVFLLLFFSSKAQDRIVDIKNDTIHCTIISITNERINYELKNSDGSVTGKFINVSQVAEYTRRSPQSENTSKPRKLKAPKPVSTFDNFWCLGLHVGGSTMPWYFDHIEDQSVIPDDYKKLTTGFHVNTSAHYMLNGFLGVGAEYSFFNSSNDINAQTQYNPPFLLMFSEINRQYINYIGPSVLFQQHLGVKRKFILSQSLSAGALFYRLENQSTYPYIDYSGYSNITSNSLITANTWSAKGGFTAEYRVLSKVSVGIGGNFLWCSIKKTNYESKDTNKNNSSSKNQELPTPLNFSRIDYSFILRYHL